MDQPSHRSRVRGCLLGGAIGDALGAPVEFLALSEIRQRFGPRGIENLAPAFGRIGAITDDTQMTLFTAEGLIRAWVRGTSRGIGHPSSVVFHAYLRWLHTQGYSAATAQDSGWLSERDSGPEQSFTTSSEYPDGWLVKERFLHDRRAPGNTCLSALMSGRLGTVERPLNDSKGCGGVMRAAPAGLLYVEGSDHDGRCEGSFALARDLAAITHGHPSGYHTAGVLAAAVHGMANGANLRRALESAIAVLVNQPAHDETLRFLQRAMALAEQGPPSPEALQSLGQGWTGEEALAIAVYAALAYTEDPRRALLLAVNHGGDSDSTGAICGNLLGVLHGEAGLPQDWLAQLEGRSVITTLADDLVSEISGTRPKEGYAHTISSGSSETHYYAPNQPGFDAWLERYPGW